MLDLFAVDQQTAANLVEKRRWKFSLPAGKSAFNHDHLATGGENTGVIAIDLGSGDLADFNPKTEVRKSIVWLQVIW